MWVNLEAKTSFNRRVMADYFLFIEKKVVILPTDFKYTLLLWQF